MPITKGAKKAIRSSKRKWVFNQRRRKALKGAVKEIDELVKKGDSKEAEGKLSDAYKAIDKAAKRGIIKKNTAARKKSRLARSVAKKA